MKQEKAFLQAIMKNPDDDAPRLVYADWLEEQGDAARAEFIRVQIELARGGVSAARRRQLKARQEELLSRHQTLWGGGALSQAGKGIYQRGFIESLRTGRRRFRQHADELFKIFPIRHLRFSSFGYSPSTSTFIAWLAKWSPLARIESLAFWGDSATGEVAITQPELSVLLMSRHLKRLRSLDISGNEAMEGTGENLAHAKVFAQLTALTLQEIDSNVVWHLTASRFKPRLTRLVLSHNDLDARAMADLAGWPAVAELANLDLGHNPIGSEGAEALAASPYLRQLSALNLTLDGFEPGIRDQGFHALVSSGKLDSVQQLNLEGNGLGPEGARSLVRLGQLRYLNLRENFNLGPEGIRVLASSANLAGLRRLNVGICGLGDAGARALARSPHLRQLIELTAYANDISDAGVRALASSPVLDRVRILRLGGNHTITDAGARALARSRHLDQLERLELGFNNGIGPEGQRLLRERFGTRVVFR